MSVSFSLRRPAVIALAAATCVVLGVASGAGSASLSDAPGGPGALSHFDLARKDCLGTARNTTSKVWFTVAGGVLSDVYYPTVDNTNVETLQYVVTDGSTFTDLQTQGYDLDGPGVGRERNDLRGHEHACQRPLPDRHRLRRRSALERVADEGRVQGRQEGEEVGQPTPLPPLRPDRERQRRWGSRERRRRLGDDRHVDRAPDPGRLRPEHGDERSQPRLRPTGLRRTRRAVRRDDERLRRDGQRRADAARRLACC